MSVIRISADSFARALDVESVAQQLIGNDVEIEQRGSFGLAWLEPLVQVQKDAELIAVGGVTTNSLPEFSDYLNQGAPSTPTPHFTQLQFVGNVQEHPFLKAQHRLIFDEAGFKAPLELPDLSALTRVLDRDPDEIIADIETSGLRGRGGAGFPAHIKWRTVADTPADQRYIVCNADEGDSGTFSDRMIMEGDPFQLIEGMVIAGYATGADKGIIYLRSEYPVALEYLNDAINKAYENQLLGANILNSGVNFDLEIFLGAGAYICGEETSLLESLEGKRGQIRTKPPVPAIAGLFQKPTLVHNTITLASVPGIFEFGAENYGQLGVGPSTGTMAFQIAGNVKCGGLVEVPFGLTVRELIEDFGQGTLSGRPFRAVQIGGPLGAYLSENELDTPLTYEAMAEIGAGIGHGGLVVFDDRVDLREQAEYAFEFCEIESCGKCTPCRIGSVRGKETVQRFGTHHDDEKTIKIIEDLCEVMEKASLCQMGGMTPIPVLSAMSRFREDFVNDNK